MAERNRHLTGENMHTPLLRSLTRIAQQLAHVIGRAPVIARVISGDATREEYARFLTGTYQYVSWSGPLLTATAEGVRRRGQHEHLSALLAAKASEESSHDQWLLNDAEHCGVGAARLRNATSNRAVDAYVAWGNALAAAGSPGYLGAAYVLESISMLRAGVAANALRSRAPISGIDNALTFLDGHAEADVEHIETLERALSTIDDPGEQAEIVASALVLSTLYPLFFCADH